MPVAITIRDVPDEVRGELAARAAREGQSLQVYLRALLIDLAARPTQAEVIARARARAKASGTQLSTEQILAALDAERR